MDTNLPAATPDTEAATTPAAVSREPVKCLNCGTLCYDKYCPRCGQSTAATRINMRAFSAGAGVSFARLTAGFLATFWGLLIHPWVVIREYLAGKRVKYSPPVTMLIQLSLYTYVIYRIIDAVAGTVITPAPPRVNIETLEYFSRIVNMIFESDTILYMVLALPLAGVCYLVYYKHGSRRFNFAEYLTAAIYMFSAGIIYDFVFFPVEIFSPSVSELLTNATFVVMGLLALNKAFPIRSWTKRVATMLCFLVVSGIAYVIIVFGAIAIFFFIVDAMLH
ncbi:MAG: DUF3667 domain-containing protein [Muribaculaceae bacterium]